MTDPINQAIQALEAVTQEDRDLFYLLRPFSPNHAYKLYGGSLDASPEMQAIARHRRLERTRLQAEAGEVPLSALNSIAPTSDGASEQPLLSERYVHAGVGHAPSSAATGCSEATSTPRADSDVREDVLQKALEAIVTMWPTGGNDMNVPLGLAQRMKNTAANAICTVQPRAGDGGGA